MIIHEFYSDIFPIQFWVLINPSQEQIDDVFEPKDRDASNEIIGNWKACVSEINIKKDTDKYGIWVALLELDKITPGVLAHEACHITDTIYTHLGAKLIDLGGEPHAYFMEWVVRCMDEAITDNKKEKMNKLKCGGKKKPPIKK